MLTAFGGPIKRIAVVRALHLGDLLLVVPALRLLRRVFTAAEITLIGLPWASDFVARFKYVDRLALFPGFQGMLEVDPDEAGLAQFLAWSKEYRFDLALQMHGSGEASAKFTVALGATYGAGYEPQMAPRLLSFSLPYPDDLPEVHRNLLLIESLTGEQGDPALEFPLLDEDILEAKRLLAEAGVRGDERLIAMHAGARPPSRRWMPERFAEVADGLGGELGATVVLVGARNEREIVRTVLERTHGRVIDVAGRTSLGGLAALLSRCGLFVGNDSGPAHVAEAVGIPSVTLFGSADPVRWAPLDRRLHRVIYKNVDCSPCGYWECPIDHRCLTRIQVKDVLEVARDLMEGVRAA